MATEVKSVSEFSDGFVCTYLESDVLIFELAFFP